MNPELIDRTMDDVALAAQESFSASPVEEASSHVENDKALVFCPSRSRLREVKDALVLYEEALAIRKRALGDDHPDVAMALSNLTSLVWSVV